jgi:beta-aspartyl-peptidase (threonine type)
VLVHGGAGELALEHKESAAEGCARAARAALEILRAGGAALDAAQRAVEELEDDPLFNAATGACLTADGRIELDAALMDGEGLRLGGVCALPPFAHPVRIARAVLDAGHHVLYAGEGAARFAEQAGFSRVDEHSLITGAARARLSQALADLAKASKSGGTVGAVARDSRGNVAAATSTGGMVAKRAGRVGDSPIPGAGTYADNSAGAVSATGEGEGILRVNLAGQLVAALRSGVDVERAVREAIEQLAARAHATGGVIAVDAAGKLAFARSTPSMTWAAAWDGSRVVSGS